MTINDVERFKKIIPQKVAEILNGNEVGTTSEIVEIKIEIRWNLYNEPVIATTTKSIHTEVIESEEVKEEVTK